MRYILFICFIMITLYRFRRCNNQGKDSSFLWISLLIQLVPLSCILLKLGTLPSTKGVLGAFDTYFAIEGLWVVYILLLFFKVRRKYQVINKSLFVFLCIIILFEIISLFNGYNSSKYSGLPIFCSFMQILFITKIVCKYVNKGQIVLGLFDGFKNAILLQFILTLLFPVLGLKFATSLFWDTGEWSNRRGMASAIGSFMHPGPLALFACMASSCFISCILNNFKRKQAIRYLLICIFIIYYTYSRTSYVAFLFVMSFLIVIYNKKRFVKSIVVIIGLISLVFLISYFVGIFDLFFKSDLSDMQESRWIHYMLALDCVKDSPIVGVGINNHVNYMSNDLVKSDNLNFNPFFYSNPIHNIHLIILVETGLLGFSLWLYYCFRNIRTIVNAKLVNICQLTFLGVLVSFITYGMTGWGPFHKGVYPILIIIWYLSYGVKNMPNKSSIL